MLILKILPKAFSFAVLFYSFNAVPAQNIKDEGFHIPPTDNERLATLQNNNIKWKFTFNEPDVNSAIKWYDEHYIDSNWPKSDGGFYRYNHAAATWLLEDIQEDGQQYVRIKNYWISNTYLHTENKHSPQFNTPSDTLFYKSPETGTIDSTWHSAMWVKHTHKDGRFEFSNRWDESNYLYSEGGYVKVGPKPIENWEPSKWSVENLTLNYPVTEQPIRLRSSTDTYLMVKNGTSNRLSSTTNNNPLDYSLSGAMSVNASRDAHKTQWHRDKNTLWARGHFTINSVQEAQNLMFWSHWSFSLSLYINGVHALDIQETTKSYRYIGMSDKARASLKTDGSSNTIAVLIHSPRLSSTGSYEHNAYFDLTPVIKKQLATLPEAGPPLNGKLQSNISNLVKDYMEQQGITAGVLALSHNQKLILNRAYGYQNKEFTKKLPINSPLRLASNDKVVTRTLINKLINDKTAIIGGETFSRNTRIFPLLEAYKQLNINSGSPSLSESITVGHLLDHKGFVANLPHLATNYITDGSLSKFYNTVGKTPQTINSHDNVRWVYKQTITREPGTGSSRYSNSGYMLLRYLASTIIKDNWDTDIESYIKENLLLDNNDQNIFIAKERLQDRHPNEPWYNDNRTSYARWIELDNYLALASSASAFVEICDQPDDPCLYNSTDSKNFGSMPGSWSVTGYVVNTETQSNIYFALIFNSGAYFDKIYLDLKKAIQDLPSSSVIVLDSPPSKKPSYRAGAVSAFEIIPCLLALLIHLILTISRQLSLAKFQANLKL